MGAYSLGSKADPSTARTRAECGNGSPPCPRAPAPGRNPLGLCDVCLDERGFDRGECPRCASIPGVPYVHAPGGMCFGCGMSPGGTLCGPATRREAHASMRRSFELFVRDARAGQLDVAARWGIGSHTVGDKLAALLSRAPDGMARQALLALAAALPADAVERVTPPHLRDVVDTYAKVP